MGSCSKTSKSGILLLSGAKFVTFHGHQNFQFSSLFIKLM
jgi:hypothetical protein